VITPSPSVPFADTMPPSAVAHGPRDPMTTAPAAPSAIQDVGGVDPRLRFAASVLLAADLEAVAAKHPVHPVVHRT
jgi:hypothetical protein